MINRGLTPAFPGSDNPGRPQGPHDPFDVGAGSVQDHGNFAQTEPSGGPEAMVAAAQEQSAVGVKT